MIDLRSDTVTVPTEEMRRAMMEAEVGDDVYGEDPTVKRLEELAADMLGKEAALFVTSGTQGNLVSMATYARRGEEIIAEAESHVFMYEAAGAASIAGAQIRQIAGYLGALQPGDVRQAIRPKDIHQPRTALVCVENTHNRAGGTVMPIETLRELSVVAKEFGIPIHMDGARLFNAVVASGTSPKEIARYVDSVQFCLSKGLGAPVGSVVCGSAEFIEGARQWRKRVGGGLRQVGVLAAPGIVALRTMVERLADDHAHALFLATRLGDLPGVTVNMAAVQTNIVIADVSGVAPERDREPREPAGDQRDERAGYGSGAGSQRTVSEIFVDSLRKEGVLASAFGWNLVRFVTHKDVGNDDVHRAVDIITRVVKSLR